jgi:hypothetical protein
VGWVVVALFGLGGSGMAQAWIARMPAAAIGGFALALVLMVAGALALARWLPSMAFAKKLRGLEESLHYLKSARPRAAPLVAAFLVTTILAFLNGAVFLLVLKAVTDSLPSFLAIIGVNAAGWLVGFFAFFAPSGLGVREGAMTAMLRPLMPMDAALVSVLLWRVLQIAAELLCLAGCFLPLNAAARRLAARSPSAG